MTKTAAIWVILLVALNRYIIVCQPLKATQWCTLSKVKIQLAAVLIAAVLYNIPAFAERRVVYYAKHNMSNNDTLSMANTEYTLFGEVNLRLIVDMLATLNSSINFLIYIVANKAFRDVLVEMVCGRHPHRPVVMAHEMDNTERV